MQIEYRVEALTQVGCDLLAYPIFDILVRIQDMNKLGFEQEVDEDFFKIQWIRPIRRRP